MNQTKETIYIDVDDDITGIIDRVVSSKETIVAAVLPKRADALHSSVNLRLLKRAAEEANKSLVLITSEAPILKLAGLTRVHVAKSLTTKPYLPEKPELEVTETIISEPLDEPVVDPAKSIGELSGDKVTKVEPKDALAIDEETIELDNLEPGGAEDKNAGPHTKKDKKLSVPSFDRFRKRIFIFSGIGLFLLIFLFFAAFVWPRATITIATEKSNVETRLEFTANIAQVALDETTKVLPAEQKEVKKTLSEKFTATGKLDNGNKATGTITIFNCSDTDATVPAGTKFTNNGFSFSLNTAVTVEHSSFSSPSSGSVCNKNHSAAGSVTAVSGGGDYNLSSGRSFSSSVGSHITGTGSAMGGGTTKLVTVVSSEDIEAAKKIIVAKSTDEYKSELSALFKASSKFGLVETFTAVQGEITSAPKIGEEAGEATLSIPFIYQMLGVNLNDIEKLLTTAQNAKIDTNKQKIYDSGIDTAKIGQLSRPTAGEAKMSLSGTGIAGPKLDADTIAKEVAGKSGGATKQIISSRPDIASVEVRYDPFWVFSTPKKVSRITIIFDAAN